MGWFADSILYHIYPLGMLGCERSNDGGAVRRRLPELSKLIPHLLRLGVSAVYFGPLFESSRHGYDTIDYFHIDRRLGTDDDFRTLVAELHRAGIRVMVDAVFNHVGRRFWGFEEVLRDGQNARTAAWFKGLRFDSHGGVRYETWEGHNELVKLDLMNNDVRQHLFDAVQWWVSQFDIDGLRMDAADCLDIDFIRALRACAESIRPDIQIIGELIHGDYRQYAGPNLMHGATNYEAWKGLWSSHNDANFHEIAYTLNRQFGENGIYRDLSMYSFADNHDVDRIASKLRSPLSLYSLYSMMFTMPGTPSLYYGSEWGTVGKRTSGYDADLDIRPALSPDILTSGQLPQTREGASLEQAIARLAQIRNTHSSLKYGRYRQIAVDAQYLIFERSADNETAICACSDLDSAKEIVISAQNGTYTDVLNGGDFIAAGGRLSLTALPHWTRILIRR